jgi:hypothetical protein
VADYEGKNALKNVQFLVVCLENIARRCAFMARFDLYRIKTQRGGKKLGEKGEV